MNTLTPDLLDWIDARSQREKEVLFGRLANEFVLTKGSKLIAVRNESDQTIAYLCPGDGSAAWPLPPESPERVAELRRRLETPGETMPFDEFIARVETAGRSNR